jgi:hypothetical protein
VSRPGHCSKLPWHVCFFSIRRDADGMTAHATSSIALSPGLLSSIHPQCPQRLVPANFGHVLVVRATRTYERIPKGNGNNERPSPISVHGFFRALMNIQRNQTRGARMLHQQTARAFCVRRRLKGIVQLHTDKRDRDGGQPVPFAISRYREIGHALNVW